MINIRRDRAIWLILIISVGLYLSIPFLSLVFGFKYKAEATEISDPVDITIEATETGIIEGTIRWNDALKKPKLEIYIGNEWKSVSLEKDLEESDEPEEK